MQIVTLSIPPIPQGFVPAHSGSAALLLDPTGNWAMLR